VVATILFKEENQYKNCTKEKGKLEKTPTQSYGKM
jgi:hypothetical protein